MSRMVNPSSSSHFLYSHTFQRTAVAGLPIIVICCLLLSFSTPYDGLYSKQHRILFPSIASFSITYSGIFYLSFTYDSLTSITANAGFNVPSTNIYCALCGPLVGCKEGPLTISSQTTSIFLPKRVAFGSL